MSEVWLARDLELERPVAVKLLSAGGTAPRFEREARALAEQMQISRPTLREAVVKRDIQELSYQEIADQLNLPEGTVKSRINRGRTELARQVQRIRESEEGTTE